MKSNVCYNLFKSPYYTQYQQHLFYFSSQFNKTRFDKRINVFVLDETNKLSSKFQCDVHSNVVLALTLYRLIEKRGFYVINANHLPVNKYYTVEMVVV